MTRSRLVVLGVAVLLVAGGFVYLQFLTSTLTVDSQPKGATVWVDGRRIGTTPLRNHELDSGTHLVVVEHSFYAPYEQQVQVAPGDHVEKLVKLEPGRATLVLQSNPRGAWVEVGGERVRAKTPTRFSLDSGVYEVRMGGDERRTVTKEITVKAGEELRVTFDLNIDPHGSLTVVGAPSGALVEVIGLDKPYQPGLRVPIGEHVVRVSKRGYETVEVRQMIQYGDNQLNVSLERAYGRLIVNAQPSPALISVDTGGDTPRVVTSEEAAAGLRLPAGLADVRVRKLGYRSQSRRVDIGQGAQTLTIQLQPMRAQAGEEIRDSLAVGGFAPTMVIVPAGRLAMTADSGARHEVQLTQPYAVSKFEVTVEEYLKFANAQNRRVHKNLNASRNDYPVTYIEIRDAHAYARWLSSQTGAVYRLPSEAEWEHAAKGGQQGDYFFTSVSDICLYANIADQATAERFSQWQTEDCNDGFARLAPIGQLRPNPFGLYDVLGNAAEWVAECGIPKLSTLPIDGTSKRFALSCSSHGMRGGTWDGTAQAASASARTSAPNSSDDRGIRLLREL